MHPLTDALMDDPIIAAVKNEESLAAALESDLEFSKTDAYIERVARGELGYVKRGEIKFVEREDGAAQGSAAEPAASVEPTATTEPAAQPDDMKEPQQTDDPNPEGNN